LPRFQKTPIYCLKQKKMKKLVLFFAVVVAVSFASCGNKAKTEAPEEVATEEVVAAEEAPVATDSTAAAAPATEAAPAAEQAAPAAN